MTHLENLKCLLVRERRWLAEDPGEEDRTEAVAALEWAVQMLDQHAPIQTACATFSARRES